MKEISIGSAARMLGMKIDTFRDRLSKGKFPFAVHTRPSGHRRFDYDEVKAYADQHLEERDYEEEREFERLMGKWFLRMLMNPCNMPK